MTWDHITTTITLDIIIIFDAIKSYISPVVPSAVVIKAASCQRHRPFCRADITFGMPLYSKE
jgi:hypothetical protein